MREKAQSSPVNSDIGIYSRSDLINGGSSAGFDNRSDAGRALSLSLLREGPFADPLLLALPRGGVPVACEISRLLKIPLDVFLIRKFALPERPEIALGTVASGGVQVFETTSLQGDPGVAAVIAREYAELIRRERSYRDSRPAEMIEGRCAIVVDDGLTTGSTMRLAIRALRLLRPARIVAAIPVASREAYETIRSEADLAVCARIPETFSSVRRWYRDFSPVLDHDIALQFASTVAERSVKAYRA